MKQVIRLTEGDLKRIVEDAVSSMVQGNSSNQQQQTQQPNDSQMTAYQRALSNYLSKLGNYMGQQFQEINRNLSLIQQQLRGLNQRIPSNKSNIYY